MAKKQTTQTQLKPVRGGEDVVKEALRVLSVSPHTDHRRRILFGNMLSSLDRVDELGAPKTTNKE